MISEKAPDPSSESTLTAKIEALVAGPNSLDKMTLELLVTGDVVFGLRSGGGASGVGTVAISISVGMTAKGGKPCRTSSESLMLDKYSGVDAWSRISSVRREVSGCSTVEVRARASGTLLEFRSPFYRGSFWLGIAFLNANVRQTRSIPMVPDWTGGSLTRS